MSNRIVFYSKQQYHRNNSANLLGLDFFMFLKWLNLSRVIYP